MITKALYKKDFVCYYNSTVKALKPAQPPIPILVVFAPPALRRAPLERCGGRPLVQVTHDAGTLRP
jgi:hypothetical protein